MALVRFVSWFSAICPFCKPLGRLQVIRVPTEAIALIGTEPIDSSTPDIFPSDHFGLVSRLRWQA
jgi:hypothetical protein